MSFVQNSLTEAISLLSNGVQVTSSRDKASTSSTAVVANNDVIDLPAPDTSLSHEQLREITKLMLSINPGAQYAESILSLREYLANFFAYNDYDSLKKVREFLNKLEDYNSKLNPDPQGPLFWDFHYSFHDELNTIMNEVLLRLTLIYIKRLDVFNLRQFFNFTNKNARVGYHERLSVAV